MKASSSWQIEPKIGFQFNSRVRFQQYQQPTEKENDEKEKKENTKTNILKIEIIKKRK